VAVLLGRIAIFRIRTTLPSEFCSGAGGVSGKILASGSRQLVRKLGSGEAKNARSDENAVSESAELRGL
jgi:hypothetical protein